MIRLIAAIDNHNGIARSGVQPWKLLTDEKYFLEQTQRFGGNVLMGRTTYEVIGPPLKDRNNFVLSRQAHTDDSRGDAQDNTKVEWITDLDTFMRSFQGDLWVIGGQSVFEQTIVYASELYITEISRDYFTLQGPRTEIKENGTGYRFCLYARV
jgi:dihydrofolate reductase